MCYPHDSLVPAGPLTPKRHLHLSPPALAHFPYSSCQCQRTISSTTHSHPVSRRLLGGASSNIQGKSCVFLNSTSSHNSSWIWSRSAFDCWRLKASLLLSPPPEMRHPGMHFQGEPTNPPSCPNICCCLPSCQGEKPILREEKQSTAGAGHKKTGEAGQDRRPHPANMPEHTNNTGSRVL